MQESHFGEWRKIEINLHQKFFCIIELTQRHRLTGIEDILFFYSSFTTLLFWQIQHISSFFDVNLMSRQTCLFVYYWSDQFISIEELNSLNSQK